MLSSQFSEIWNATKRKYNSATEENIDDSSFPHPKYIDELVSSVDAKDNEFKHFREKKALILHVVQQACKPIEAVGGLTAGAGSMVFLPSSLCCGAMMHLVNAADGVSASYDSTIELLQSLKARKPFGKNLLNLKDKVSPLITELETLCQTEHLLVGAEILAELKSTGRAVLGVVTKSSKFTRVVEQTSGNVNKLGGGVRHISDQPEEMWRDMQKGFTGFTSALETSKESDFPD
ncbi:hypothetical protein AJ79_06949 [Helicocarpus griseus UAMH5409]|uniref:Fungal STAND N-terminal Goodbye domain-containing protein n=1 Tax=Helicocarpus griseus UAMH5409 TaxID=1447875 RepID=A0A2B7WZU3_9EURO|nr:hypothetical protein AJ79_06949 [Helicocarpus griseus UAMH5409]